MIDQQSVPNAEWCGVISLRMLCTFAVRRPKGAGSNHGKRRPYLQPNEKHESLDSLNITSLNT